MTRPDVLKGSTPFVKTKCGKIYITVNVNEEGRPCEIQMRLGKTGTCARAWNQSVGELLSDFLKTSKVGRIWKHFYGIDCGPGNTDGVSCQAAIALVLEPYVTDREFVREVKERVAQQRVNESKVPEEGEDAN